MSARHDRPFVRKGCGEFDPGTGAAALFGHSRGAFTDAKTSQEGLLDLANGGTLLLDDVDYMPLELQTKLIRFLDDATYAPLGRPNDLKTADVRIIATSNKPLDDLIREGRFLHDLDARLRDWTVQLPSLKQDRHHLLRLARHFLSAEQQRSGLRVEECRILSPEAEVALVTLEYPYNARDLMRLVKRIIRLDRSVHREISAKLISVAFNISRPSIQRYRTPTYSPKFERIRNVKSDRLTDEDIYRSLVGNGWVIQRTAEDLCLSRTTIYNKIKKNNWRKAT
jgi:DNA-binding NtrC family response regulator